ncbi:hypothetical protein CKO32_16765 [Afifella marina DSM 2698]|nr:hypothetical protein [Afifella marina DSM 2698]MBK1628930.1 hypothetical protein [Afifella marina]MBK5918309.1 hypothetical protein [Afifella marina]RAI22828.1 hypothetical protein CH311_04025 [Afifella marina DSM 2698]
MSTSARRANMASIVAGLDVYGEEAGLLLPHRLAQYIAQVAHESARFIHDREIWGPTAAQRRYDTRTDLGNTADADGDGYLYRGRTTMQLTGRRNYTKFFEWCLAKGLNPPDFVADPAAVNTDPWEGLAPIWYWDVGNPEGRSLNVYADDGNNEMVTRRINGGTTGLPDRLELYTRAALVFLGYARATIVGFLEPDAAGAIVVDNGTKYAVSAERTRWLRVRLSLPPGTYDGEMIREIGLFASPTIAPSVPAGQTLIDPADVSDPGDLMRLIWMEPQPITAGTSYARNVIMRL